LVAEPPDNTLPPVAVLYQSITAPDDGVAVSVTVPAPQREALTTDETLGVAFTVANTAVREADTQPVAAIRACA
jgi:hypothetical protein